MIYYLLLIVIIYYLYYSLFLCLYLRLFCLLCFHYVSRLTNFLKVCFHYVPWFTLFLKSVLIRFINLRIILNFVSLNISLHRKHWFIILVILLKKREQINIRKLVALLFFCSFGSLVNWFPIYKSSEFRLMEILNFR